MAGFTVVVRGGRKHGGDGHLRVQDGELIEVALRRTDAITPSPAQESSETENSGDGDGDETSEAEDPLPDSSDFSTEGPTGAGPWGPPPPQPVNRERSRTPTRHQGLQPIELANLLPVPSYDLTVDTLQLPSIPETWKSCPKLWDLDWLNLQRLPLKTATKQALQEAVTWQELLARPRQPHELEVQLYTDGSAVASPQRSGYVVTIILRLGSCFAVFGIIGDQLVGNGSTVWPVDAPLPLRSEQVAVVVAMLWVLQFRALLPEIQCKVKFDCLAAGYATNGRWQAPDHFGEQAHLLELFLREQPGLSRDGARQSTCRRPLERALRCCCERSGPWKVPPWSAAPGQLS